jgi:hypothetical protein
MANQNPIGSATGTLANGSQNTTYTLYESTLLQGFSDPDGDTLKISGFWADSGELTDLGNGQWSFVPETDYSGAVVFDYVLLDSEGGEIQGTLSFNIVALQTPPTGSISISGTAQQNQTLISTNTLADLNGLGAISYSWLSNGSLISNQPSYTLTQNDVGKTISVTASYTDGLGKLESVSSSSVTVSNVNDLPIGSVTINGEAKVGQTLNVSNSLVDVDGLGVINYSWLSNGAVLSNQLFYTLTQNDVGKTISVTANYTDLQGTAESVTSSSVTVAAPINYLPTGSVTISGTAQQNQTLTATNTLADLNGLGAINYSWLSNGSIISNQPSYALTQNDVNKTISVTASYTDGLGKIESVSSSSVTVSNVNDSPTGSVTINGDTKVGQTLFANTSNVQDLDGLGVMNYQWMSNSAIINGKTQQNYTLVSEDANKNISVKVSYTDGFGNFEQLPSPSLFVQPVVIQPTKPTYSLTVDRVDVNEGESVYFKIATTNVPLESNINMPFNFSGSITSADVVNGILSPKSVWIGKDGIGTVAVSFLNDKITEGKENLIATLQTDSNQSVTVDVNDTSYANVVIPKINNLPTGEISIIGEAKIGKTLTIQNTLNDADGLGVISYQWLKNDIPISGATQENYTLTKADLGKAISVTANYVDGLKNTENVTSDTTDLIEVSEPTYSLTVNKTELNEGETLTFKLITTNLPAKSIVDFNFGGAISDDDVTGGLPESQFIIDASGKASLSLAFAKDKITEGNEDLTLTLADDLTQTLSINVNDTSVAKIVNHKPTGDVKIQGTAKVNAVLSLTNTLQDTDGLGEFNYQWLSNGVAIKKCHFRNLHAH